eukprot:UN21146
MFRTTQSTKTSQTRGGRTRGRSIHITNFRNLQRPRPWRLRRRFWELTTPCHFVKPTTSQLAALMMTVSLMSFHCIATPFKTVTAAVYHLNTSAPPMRY